MCLSLFHITCFIQSIRRDACEIVNSWSRENSVVSFKILPMVMIPVFEVPKALIVWVFYNCSKLVQEFERILLNFMDIRGLCALRAR